MQEKESIMAVRGRQKNPSLAITVWHHPTSLVMPDSDPWDGFFYLPLTPMIDPYNLLLTPMIDPYYHESSHKTYLLCKHGVHLVLLAFVMLNK